MRYVHAHRPDFGFAVGRPGALTTTAVAMKSKMLNTKTTAPAINEQAIEATKQMIAAKEQVYTPMPDSVRAQLRGLAKSKERK